MIAESMQIYDWRRSQRRVIILFELLSRREKTKSS